METKIEYLKIARCLNEAVFADLLSPMSAERIKAALLTINQEEL